MTQRIDVLCSALLMVLPALVLSFVPGPLGVSSGSPAPAARGTYSSDFNDLSDIFSSDHVHVESGYLKLNSSGSSWAVPTGEAPGSYWQYTTSSPGASWNTADYDDSGWSSGEAPFGMDYNTNLNPRTYWNSPDIWIRHSFSPGFSPADADRMMLRYWHDEGVEVYLNGQSLYSESGYVDRYVDLVLDSGKLQLLQAGTNVLAAHCRQQIYAAGIDLGLQCHAEVRSGNATSVVVKAPAGERFSSFDADVSAGGTAELQVSILNATTFNPLSDLYKMTDFPLDLGALKVTSLRVRFHLSTTGTDIPMVRRWSVSWTPDIPYMVTPLPENITLPEDTDLPRALDLSPSFKDDLFPNSALRFTVTSQSDPDHLYAALTGSFLDLTTPQEDWFGTASFRVLCSNGYYSAFSNTFNITVMPVNDPVVIDPVPALQAVEDVAFSYRFTAVDNDIGTDPAERLTFTVNTTGFPLTPPGWMNFTPTNDLVGVHVFTVAVRDHAGVTDSTPVVLSVKNTNDPPEDVHVLAPSNGASFNEHTNITLSANATDADGDALVFTWSDVTGGVLGTGAQLTLALPPGIYFVHVNVSDGNATVSSPPITIKVVNVNDPPEDARVILPVNGSVYNERTAVVFRACATDPDGDRLDFTWTGAGGLVIGTGAEFTTAALAPGKHSVQLEVSDGKLSVRPPPVDITINNINDPPQNVTVLYPANGTSVKKGAQVMFSASAVDPDNDTLNFTWRDSNGNVVGYGEEFTTRHLASGTHSVHVDVSDGARTVSSKPVAVIVKAPPPAAGKGFLPGPGFALTAAALALIIFVIRRRND